MLTPLETSLNRCYHASLKKTWYIESKNENYAGAYGTGFSLYEDRILCTCAHVVKVAMRKDGDQEGVILGYQLKEEESVAYQLQVILYKPQWDLALLGCKEITQNQKDFSFKIECDNLQVGQGLAHIGCGDQLGGSLYKFNIANDLPKDEVINLEKYNQNDIKREWAFNSFLDEEKLEPLLPIIELSGGALGGCSGGPVFDLNGDLVGMILAAPKTKSFALALHGAVILKAYKECCATQAYNERCTTRSPDSSEPQVKKKKTEGASSL